MQIYGKSVALIEETDGDKFGENGGFTAVLSTPSLDRDGDRLHRDEWIEPLDDRYPLDIDHGMSVADTVGSFHPYFDDDRMLMDAYFASTPKAQEVRTLIQEGHIRNVSVAFMTDKSKKDSEPKRELLNAGIVATPSNRDAVILASKAASALKDAFSDATEGEVPEEVKTAVLEALGKAKTTEDDEKSSDKSETRAVVYVDVIPRLDKDALKFLLEDIEISAKAAATASGVGGDGALVQAIHDASSHLGAACPVIEVEDEGTGAPSGANKEVNDIHVTDKEAFEKALDQALNPQEAESPAETAAASDEEPAPAEDAADDVDDAEVRARAMQMSLALFNHS